MDAGGLIRRSHFGRFFFERGENANPHRHKPAIFRARFSLWRILRCGDAQGKVGSRCADSSWAADASCLPGQTLGTVAIGIPALSLQEHRPADLGFGKSRETA